MKIPSVWSESLEGHVGNILLCKAAALARANTLPANLAEWEKRAKELRRLVAQHTHIQYENSLPLDCQVTKTIQCDGYSIQCLHFQSRPGIRMTGCLYVPDGDGIFPAVLNVHGHWAQGHLSERVQARGHSLAKNGFVCLSVDAWGSGERSWSHGKYRYHGNTLGGGLFQYGETLMGAQIADNMRAIDLLLSLPFVDGENIGVTGASGGGNQTMWLAAMDERIKAAMPVVSVGTFEAYVMSENCVCELLPDGLTFTEEDGILALAAPRYLKLCNALKDTKSFSVAEMLRSYNKARDIFKLYGAEDHFTYQSFNTVHGYWPEIRETMLGFFKMTLMGKGNGAAISEIPFTTLPEKQIMTFEPGKRPDNFGTIEEYLALKAKSIPERSISPNDAKSEFDKLAEAMRFDPAVQSTHIMRLSDVGGWHRCTVIAQDSRAIPILYKVNGAQSTCSKAYAFSSPSGKASLEETPMLRKALADENACTIIFDAFATGEMACDNANAIS
ncbi:MAG: acetylxylan esterase, partial [Victivallales bacterium]|nr:acetylxylan esterase [Victivallales bacterium]